jgi:Mycothiol maleylpyruvate isomerase N-terminal domain
MSHISIILEDAAMSRSTEALSADRTALIGICSGLDASDWNAPSGCSGWSVKDVVSHMAALYWVVVDPTVVPDTSAIGTEEGQELVVQSRRKMTADETLHDYSTVSEKAIAILDTFEGVDVEMAVGDLGTYPMSILPTAFCFDHYTHIRTDLFAPRGPFNGPLPPSDELRVTPALDWIEVAVPQQNSALLDGLDGGADIVITGTGARRIRVGRADGEASAVVRSDADSCVRWITQRADWKDLEVEVEGDTTTLALVQHLKVF